MWKGRRGLSTLCYSSSRRPPETRSSLIILDQFVRVPRYSRVISMASASGMPPSIRLFLNSATAFPMLAADSGEKRLSSMPLIMAGSFVESVSKISATSAASLDECLLSSSMRFTSSYSGGGQGQ